MTKKLKITVSGKTYDVEVEMLGGAVSAPAPVAVAAAPVAAAPVVAAAVAAPAAAPVAAAPAAAGAGDVVSPLSAVVVSVDVTAGQQVKEGDQLFTLEAMKMNTFVFAPKAGTVGAAKVSAGQSVAEGQALITIS